MKFYDEIVVIGSDQITVQDVQLPTSNKRIKLTVNGTNALVDVFLFFDNQIIGPIHSGDRVSTPVIPVLHKIIETPYDAKAIVIPRTSFRIPYCRIEFDYAVKSSMNVTATAHLSVEYEGDYTANDSRSLAQEFVSNTLSPSQQISNFIKNYIESRQTGIVAQLDEICDETMIANKLPYLSEVLSENCRKGLKLSWAKIDNLRITVKITNMDQIMQELNRRANTEIAHKEKRFDHELELEKLIKSSDLESQRIMIKAIADVFTQPILDPNLSQVIITYLQCNPGLSYDEMTYAFRKILQFGKRASWSDLLTAMNKVLPARKD